MFTKVEFLIRKNVFKIKEQKKLLEFQNSKLNQWGVSRSDLGFKWDLNKSGGSPWLFSFAASIASDQCDRAACCSEPTCLELSNLPTGKQST